MAIKNLKEDYPLVYRSALANQLTQGNDINEEVSLEWDDEGGNFDWEMTSEGFDFWDYIYMKKFEEAKDICPELFVSTMCDK